ncbi:MAG: hypothetical protein GXW99_03840 [Clostridiales bacterium]|nr:hypothetical protein [Clostridiales bacterium]
MENISREYLLLFNTITDTEQELSRLNRRLILAQQRAEELFINGEEAEDSPNVMPTAAGQ